MKKNKRPIYSKWQERLQSLPEFIETLDVLKKSFPDTLAIKCPKELKWSKGKPLFSHLMQHPPPARPQYPDGGKRQKLFDFCAKYDIEYFIGDKPFPKPTMIGTTNFKTGEKTVTFKKKTTIRDMKLISEFINEELPNVPKSKENKIYSKKEISTQKFTRRYKELEEQGWGISRIHKTIAMESKTTVQRVKNLLSR